MLHELAWEFYDLGVASGQRKTFVGPEFATNEGEGIREGGEGFWVPAGAADGGRGPFRLPVGVEGDEGEQAEQGRGGAANRQLRPLALGLQAEVAAGLFPGHFQLPAQHEPGEDLFGRGVQVGAEQGLGGEGALRIADQDPAQRHRRQAAVVPDGGVRRHFYGALALAVPVRYGHARPVGLRVVGHGRQRRQPLALAAGPASTLSVILGVLRAEERTSGAGGATASRGRFLPSQAAPGWL
jgi:hypothetical protein